VLLLQRPFCFFTSLQGWQPETAHTAISRFALHIDMYNANPRMASMQSCKLVSPSALSQEPLHAFDQYDR
jgi:hypothetical protein